MIYILDNGDMFPKLLKTITKWLDFEVKITKEVHL